MTTLPAILESIKTRRDKTISLVFATQELTPEKASELFGFVDKFCYLAIKSEDFKKDEIDAISKLKVDYDDPTKTPAKRLRGVLFRNWELNSEGYKKFELYYDSKMEAIITHFKGKLP
jgi:isopentenyldiphosphate isomerase